MLLACGAIASPLWVVTVVAQALTRSGFSLTRDAASLLDNGGLGWIQVANFIVTGLLFIAAAAGLRRALRDGPGSRWTPRLLTITGRQRRLQLAWSAAPGMQQHRVPRADRVLLRPGPPLPG
jgi:hypothetical protein